MTIATKSATTNEMSAAHCAFSLSPPSSTNSVMIGSAAKIVDRPSELLTGSVTCWYMGSPLPSRTVQKVSYPCLNRAETVTRFVRPSGGAKRECDAVKWRLGGGGHGCPRCFL